MVVTTFDTVMSDDTVMSEKQWYVEVTDLESKLSFRVGPLSRQKALDDELKSNTGIDVTRYSVKAICVERQDDRSH